MFGRSFFMYYDLTRGKISHSLILFACRWSPGKFICSSFTTLPTPWSSDAFLGSNALAAVGSSYTLMTFLTSIFLGLSMEPVRSFRFISGTKDLSSLKLSILHTRFCWSLPLRSCWISLFMQASSRSLRFFFASRMKSVPACGRIFDYLCRPYCNIRIQFLFLYAARAQETLLCRWFFSLSLLCWTLHWICSLSLYLPFGIAGRGARYGSCACVRRRYSALYCCSACRMWLAVKKNGVSAIPF